jgi:tripartite ATP-independent transporter DctM subunit
VITGTSIAALFIGGILPGLIVGFALMTASYCTSKRKGFGLVVNRFSLVYLVQTLQKAVLPLLIPGIVIGGILFGIFTATEAAVIVVFFGLFLSMTLYRELNLRDLGDIVIQTVKMSAGILLIVTFASVCSTLLTIAQIPQQLALFISHLSSNPYVVMIIVNVFLLVVGCVMDLAASLLILAPLLLPVVENLGVSPVYFGVVMCVNLGIGLITPPVGNILYVVMGIADTDISSLMKDMAPFYVTLALLLVMLIFAPQIVMFLPNLLVK